MGLDRTMKQVPVTLPFTQRKRRLDEGEDNGYPLKRNSFDFALLGADAKMASIWYGILGEFQKQENFLTGLIKALTAD